jgi:hypothetical protein
VRPTGANLWRFRYRIADRENVFAIGDYPSVALAEVRAEQGKVRALVKQGIHPSHSRQTERLSNHAANANTFEAVAKEWISRKSPGWTLYYLRQVERFLESDVFPHIGRLPIRSVTAAHLLAIIRRIEGRGRRPWPCWFASKLRIRALGNSLGRSWALFVVGDAFTCYGTWVPTTKMRANLGHVFLKSGYAYLDSSLIERRLDPNLHHEARRDSLPKQTSSADAQLNIARDCKQHELCFVQYERAVAQ